MQKSNKLNGKDLINVGIYTAMTLVIFFVFGLLTSLPVIYPFLLFIWPFVCGIPMMLYYTKIQKFGMLTITGVICGLFFFLIGYTSFKVTFLSYACFCLGMMGCPANLWIAGQSYWENIHSSMGDQYAETLQSMMPSWMMYAGFLILFVGGICGALLGHKMLKKHFERAGIV